MFDDGSTNDAIFKNLSNISKYCIPIIKNTFNKDNIRYLYIHCKFEKCLIFNVRIENSLCHVKCFGTYNESSHSTKILKKSIKGKKRSDLKKNLHQKKAASVHVDITNSIDMDCIINGNETDNVSLNALRKIRQEELSQNDKSNDDFIDLYLRRQELEVNKISMPFSVSIFSKDQINLILQQKNLIIEFDATGTVVRQQNGKNVLYYAGVINLNKIIIPVYEFLSVDQSSISIQSLFLDLRKALKLASTKWPPFEYISTDFSLPIINAICISLNSMEISEYLNLCYTNPSIVKKTKVKLSMCTSHFVKMIIKMARKCYLKSNTRHFIILCICQLIPLTNMFNFFELAMNILIIISSKFCCIHFIQSYEISRYLLF